MEIRFEYLLLVVFAKVLAVNSVEFNMSVYYKMPVLYKFDDYDRCLFEDPTEKASAYCFVVNEIIPNNSVKIWHTIESISANTKQNFRHDHLIRGICVDRCTKLISQLNDTEREQIYGGKFGNSLINSFVSSAYGIHKKYRSDYNKIINQCLNYDFIPKYGLTLRSTVFHCVTNKDKWEIGIWEYIVGIVVGVVVICNILSSFYDFYLKRQQAKDDKNRNHYIKTVKGRSKSLFVAFSVCRNYYRLVLPSKNPTSFSRDLRFLEAFRFFMIYGVILTHTVLGLNILGLANTEFIENFYNRHDKTILINGTLIMQTFFTISGFLLMNIFHEIIKRKEEKDIKYMPILIRYVVFRFVRLFPMTGIGILLSIAVTPKLGDGPYWLHATESERVFCLKSWWANLLFVNNYVNADEQCMPQVWYLATDFQLYILGLIFIIILCKFPKKQNLIFGIGMLTSLIGPSLSTYFHNIYPIVIGAPETYRYGALMEREYPLLYVPTHNNLAGYLSGIMFGKIYIYLKANNYRLDKNNSFILLWYCLVPTGFAIIMSGELFYMYDNVPIIYSALYAGCIRTLYALLSGTIILGMSFKIGWIGYEFSSLPVFRFLGRITFCALIMHTTMTRILAAEFRQPPQMGILFVNIHLTGVVILTFLSAFLMALFVELPISALVKFLLGSPTTRKPDTKNILNGHSIDRFRNNFKS